MKRFGRVYGSRMMFEEMRQKEFFYRTRERIILLGFVKKVVYEKGIKRIKRLYPVYVCVTEKIR